MKAWFLVFIIVLFGFVQVVVSESRSLNGMIRGKTSGLSTLPRSSTGNDDKIVLAGSEGIALKGSSTISTSVFNLAKTILGAGVLSLPFGVAAFTDSPQGLIPAAILLVLMGIMSAYSFSSIGKACHEHSARSFSEAWSKSVNPQTSGALNFIIIFKTFFACLAYSIIIGDSFSSIFQSIGLPAVASDRTNVIVAISSLVLLPLSLLKNLDALKYTSLLGLAGTLYTAVFMAIRYLDKSYVQGGKYFAELAQHAKPAFNQRSGPLLNDKVFVLISMISTAFVCHYNAPKFYTELKDASMPRYNLVTVLAFAFSLLMYVAMMSFGFLTFGGNSLGLVLNNYSSKDVLATGARVAIGLGILCSYPLTFTALRDSVSEALSGVLRLTKDQLYLPLTLGLLAAATYGALILRNVGQVVGFSGALIGSMLIYIVPSLMNIGSAFKRGRGVYNVEVLGNMAMVVFGVIITVIGVKTSVGH